ncbi:MAG: NADH-quinone oxidoreductase subunit J [Polyangiaceae bacterium]
MLPLGYVYFWLCAAVAIFGALVTILAKDPVRGALGLLTSIIAVAGHFLALHAQFLAAIQLIVYAGAVVVIFMFVIMVLGKGARYVRDGRGLVARVFAGALFATSSGVVLFLVAKSQSFAKLSLRWPVSPPTKDFGGTDAVGRQLFTDGIVPFELSSALLMVAAIGAIAIAKGKSNAKKRAAEVAAASLTSSGSSDSALPGALTESKAHG